MRIGLYGAAGSGKDTAAARLVSAHDFTRFAFADPLKDLASAIGWDGEKDEAGRKLLQDLGHNGREILGANVWVDALERNVFALLGNEWPWRNIVVTDVRYPNEVAWVKRLGLLVRVDRPSLDTSAPMYQHPTETNIAAFTPDRVVVNDGTVADLWAKMDLIVRTAAVGV